MPFGEHDNSGDEVGPSRDKTSASRLRDSLTVLTVSIITHTFWIIRGLRLRANDVLNNDFIPIRIAGDSGTYVTLARNIRWRQVFSEAQVPPFDPTYLRPPLYPLLIALTGPNTKAVVIVQGVLVISTSLLTYLIARSFGRKVALVSGIAMALAPMSGAYAGEIMTETFYTFLVTLAVYFWSRKHFYGAGVVFGLSWLVRPSTLPFVIALIAIGLFRRSLLKIAVAACLVCLPWTVRNAVVFHKFIPVADGQAARSLLTGALDIEYGKDYNVQIHDSVEINSRSPAEMRTELIRLVTSDPLGWVVNRVKQMPRFFIDLGPYLSLSPVVKYSFFAANILFWLLAAWGWWLNRSVLYLSLFPAVMILTHLPIFVEPRYSLPMVPMMIVLAVAVFLRPSRRSSLNRSIGFLRPKFLQR